MNAAPDSRVFLLDVNVLVALFDIHHTHHEPAHEWFADRHRDRWATCPITENGFARVMSNVGYPGTGTTLPDAIERLRTFRRSGGHLFWPDAVSLCDENALVPEKVRGAGQVADVYLLALAVANEGALATFDRRISPDAVSGATPDNLVFI